MITPQLRKLIDDINNRKNRQVIFEYMDDTTALMTVKEGSITITSDLPQLIPTLAIILERILSGDIKGVIDKKPN